MPNIGSLLFAGCRDKELRSEIFDLINDRIRSIEKELQVCILTD